MLKLFDCFGLNRTFTRADIMKIIGITASPAADLMNKMKKAGIIKKSQEFGRYLFVMPEEEKGF